MSKTNRISFMGAAYQYIENNFSFFNGKRCFCCYLKYPLAPRNTIYLIKNVSFYENLHFAYISLLDVYIIIKHAVITICMANKMH